MNKDEKIAALERRVQEQQLLHMRLENIERLLRTLPEIIAAQIQIEREHANRCQFVGKSYEDSITVPAPQDR